MMIKLTSAMIIIIGIFLVGFILLSDADINYSISLADPDVPRGTDVKLNFEIITGSFSGTFKDVKLYYNIKDHTEEQFREMGTIGANVHQKSTITIETSDIPRGEHTITTHLDYWLDGKLYAKYLTLKLVVY